MGDFLELPGVPDDDAARQLFRWWRREGGALSMWIEGTEDLVWDERPTPSPRWWEGRSSEEVADALKKVRLGQVVDVHICTKACTHRAEGKWKPPPQWTRS